MDDLIAVTSRTGDGHEVVEPTCGIASLLFELARSRLTVVFTQIQLACGNLYGDTLKRRTILTHNQHAARIVQGNDGNSARVANHLSTSRRAAGQHHVNAIDLEEAAVKRFLTADDMLLEQSVCIACVNKTQVRPP